MRFQQKIVFERIIHVLNQQIRIRFTNTCTINQTRSRPAAGRANKEYTGYMENEKVTKELNHMCVTDSFVYVKVCGSYETKISQSTQ
ncbi:hypothetical protein YC2023_015794 [Brassica napus]